MPQDPPRPLDGRASATRVEAFVAGELGRLLQEPLGVALVIGAGEDRDLYVQVSLGIPSRPEDAPTGAQVEVCGPTDWPKGFTLSETGVEALVNAGFAIGTPPDYPNWARWIEPFDREQVGSLLALGLLTLGHDGESLRSELITRVDKYEALGSRTKLGS
jgi:hypothetical protein